MGKVSMEQELERLRAEVAALTARCNEVEAKTVDDEQPNAETVNVAFDSTAAEPGSESVIKHQFEELIEMLEHEIRDLPTITCIAVFSLGIILGRYLR